MPFTLWKRGVLIGETDLEIAKPGDRRRAGVLHPTPAGMMTLPALTAMAPALFALGESMNGLRLSDDAIERGDDAALEVFERSLDGQRVLAAAEQIAELELRDTDGKPVAFESILVTDLEELVIANGISRSEHPNGDPVRYLISLTLSKHQRSRPRRAVGGSVRPT